MSRTFYSGHLSTADVNFRSQLTFLPRTDFSIADKPDTDIQNIQNISAETSP